MFFISQILEVILIHGLQQSGNFRCGHIREAKRLRLVSKTWLLQINHLFQKRGTPLVCVGRDNVKKFLELSDASTWSTPPINLSLGPEALLFPDFYEDLRKFFGKGSHLEEHKEEERLMKLLLCFLIFRRTSNSPTFGRYH